MPVTPTYPGVYVEELPRGVRAITPAGTSTGAFIGYTPRGPVDVATHVGDVGAYTRVFGGLDRDSPISYAVQQFFLNGGGEAYIVRVARGVATAGVTLRGSPGDVLRVEARNPGRYGNLIRLEVDRDTSNPDDTFNLRVTRYAQGQAGIEVAETEQFRNLTMDSSSGMYAPDVVTTTSTLIRAWRPSGITAGSFTQRGWSLSGDLSGLTSLPGSATSIQGVLDHREPFTLTINPSAVTDLATLLTQVRNAIGSAGLGATTGGPAARLSAERADPDGTVSAPGDHLLIVSQQRDTTAGPTNQERNEVSAVEILPTEASRRLSLGLANGGRERSGAAGVDGLLAFKFERSRAKSSATGRDGSSKAGTLRQVWSRPGATRSPGLRRPRPSLRAG